MPNTIYKKRLRVRKNVDSPWIDIPAIVSTPGGLDPVDKTSAMTQPVGKGADGKLWTEPTGGGGGGTGDHTELTNRDAPNQHPMSAITGLEDALDGKQSAGDYLTEETDPTVPAWAKQPQKPTYTAQEVGALPADTPIPSAVTESTVAGWGFTKNTGTYTKPSSGIPESDLVEAVRQAIALARTALQEHQSLSAYRTSAAQDVIDAGKQPLIDDLATIRSGASSGASAYHMPTDGIPETDLAAAVQSAIALARTALQEHQSLAAYRTAAAQDLIDAELQPKLTAGSNITITNNVISSVGGGNEMTVFDMGTATYSDVKAAYDAGKDIVAYYAASHYYMPLTRYAPTVNGGTFYFGCWTANTLRYTTLSGRSGWAYTEPYSQTPVATTTLSTKGDLLVRDSSTNVRLGIGTSGQVLTVVDGLPAWQTLETYDGDVEYLTAYTGGVH